MTGTWVSLPSRQSATISSTIVRLQCLFTSAKKIVYYGLEHANGVIKSRKDGFFWKSERRWPLAFKTKTPFETKRVKAQLKISKMALLPVLASELSEPEYKLLTNFRVGVWVDLFSSSTFFLIFPDSGALFSGCITHQER